MSKQQDTEKAQEQFWSLVAVSQLPDLAKKSLHEIIDQQKAEAADQAVQEFATELNEYIETHEADTSAGMRIQKQLQVVLEQFLGKGKV